MKISTKSFLIALPIGILITTLLVILGFTFFGEAWSMKGFPIISLFTGLFSYFSIKRYFESKKVTNTQG